MTSASPERRLHLLPFRLRGSPADVRPEERTAMVAAFLTLGGFMVGHALLETARDALFLARLPASQLPWAYLAIGAAGLILVHTRPRAFDRLSADRELSAWLGLAGFVTLGLWALTARTDRWVPYVVYVWTGALATLVVVRFWTWVGSLFTVTQAKRLFAIIGVGSVLGAIIGSAVARVMTELVPARQTILLASLAFFATAVLPHKLRTATTASTPVRPPGTGNSIWEIPELARLAWSRPYVRRLSLLILVSTVTLTLADFVFKSSVDRYVAPDDMGRFFSSVYLGVNVLSLVAQTAGAAWIFRHFGVDRAQAVVPSFILLASGGFVVLGGLSMALVLRLTDGALRHSLYRTGTELLFVPLSVEVRGRVKGVIDVLGQRGGQALASLLILLGLSMATDETGFAIAVVAGSGLWLFLTLDLRRLYVDVFRETLLEVATDTSVRFPALDVASLETLVTTLGSPDDAKVRAALEILDSQGRARIIPPLMLYHPTPGVVLQTLDIFLRSEREDFLPLLDRLIAHADPAVRAASLRAVASLRPSEAELRAAVDDPAPEVAATALVSLVARSANPPSDALARLSKQARGGTVEARVAVARAIGVLEAPQLEEILLELADTSEEEVQREAIQAMSSIASYRCFPLLVSLLSRRSLEDEVRTALVRIGPPALAYLEQALRDDGLPHAVRRRLPSAVRSFGSPAAARILESRLLEERDGMVRFKVLRALGRLQTEVGQIQVDRAVVGEALRATLEAAFRLLRWRRRLEASTASSELRSPLHDLLVDLLRDKEDHAVERIFRLLNLQTHKEEFHAVHRGLHSPSADVRAGSRELAEKLAPPEVRRALVSLLDDLFDGTGGSGESDDEDGAEVDVLVELLECDLESLSSVAAQYIAVSGRAELADRVARRSPLTPDHAEVLRRARGQLRDADESP